MLLAIYSPRPRCSRDDHRRHERHADAAGRRRRGHFAHADAHRRGRAGIDEIMIAENVGAIRCRQRFVCLLRFLFVYREFTRVWFQFVEIEIGAQYSVLNE